MNENIKSASLKTVVDRAKINTQSLLTEFSYSKDFFIDINTAFGGSFSQSSLEQFHQQWQENNFNNFPEIEIISSTDINGANGAFSRDTNKIYLAQEFLLANKFNIDAIATVLLEEYGHYIDSQFNVTDAPGDEGAIFVAVVQGKELSVGELQQLRNEDDSAVVILDGAEVEIERATTSNPFYEYKIITSNLTGTTGFSALGTGPSINDSGNVAFSAEGTRESVYVRFEDGTYPIDVTGFDRSFSNYVQINDNNQVVATERTDNNIFGIRTWDANNPGSNTNFIGGSVLSGTSFDFHAVLAAPSINNNGEFVFSALDTNDFTVVTTSNLATDDNFDVFQDTLSLGTGGQRFRPMMDDNGNFVARFLDRDSAITLFNCDLNSTGIARSADGFSNRGLSPGISDDGQFIVFAAENPNLGGKGIFLAYKDANPLPNTINVDGRTIIPISLSQEMELNGGLEGFVIPGELSDFDIDARVAVSSRISLDDNRSITVAYIGYDAEGNRGLYTTEVNFFGDNSSAFNPDDPFFISPQPPTLVVEEGQTLDGIGEIAEISINDPINDRDRGELAFWVKTTNGDEAIIKAEQQKVIVLDFNPSSVNLSDFAQNLFSSAGVTGQSWQGGLENVFSFYGRDDLVGDITNIKNDIVSLVQEKFDAVDANVKVVSSENAPLVEDGAVTRVLIGDSPFGAVNSLFQTADESGILNGIASSVDLFDQDIFYQNIDSNKDGIVGNTGDIPLFLPFGEDTVFVFADNIFRTVDINADGTADRGSFTDNLAGNGELVDLSNTSEIGELDVINALTNMIAHEVGHSLGLSHLDNTRGDLVMNQRAERDELRATQQFSEVDVNLEEYPAQQNDRDRLAYNVGSSDSTIQRDPPSAKELSDLEIGNRKNLSFSPVLSSALSSQTVNSAFIGIVPGGEYDSFPLFIDLGSGTLGDLLATNIPIGEKDRVIFGASTDGNGIDIFGVPNESINFVDEVDLSNPVLVASSNLIRGEVFDDGGELESAPLNLFQNTGTKVVQIGTLGVTETNSAELQANNDLATTNKEEAVAIAILDNDVDPDNNALNISSFDELSVEGGTISLSDNETPENLSDDLLVYTPATGFVGEDSFTYIVSNGLNNATAKVSITVNPDEYSPIAVDDEFSFDYGASSFSGNVLTNDSDPNEDELTVNESLIEQPSSGSVSIESNGSFSYYNPNFIGTDRFIYEVSDSQGNTDTATVTINISPNVEFPWQVGEINLIENSLLTAPLADGGFVTIGDRAGTEFMPGGLTGQRYDAQGQPVGDSFWIHTWSNPSSIYAPIKGNVVVESSPESGFLLLWTDSYATNIRLYDENSNPITSVLNIDESSNFAVDDVTPQSLTAINNGNYVIAYVDSSTFKIEVYDHSSGELLNQSFLEETTTIVMKG